MTDPTSLEKTDIALGTVLASRKGHPVVRTAAEIGKLGDQGPLYAGAAAVILVAAASKNCRLLCAGVSMLAAVAAADAAKSAAKRCVHRTRPYRLLDEGRYALGAGGAVEKPEQSFPSGHVAGTLAAAGAISRCYPGATPWAFGAVVVIGLARLAKGAHWPLDVAGGALLGAGAEALSWRLVRWAALQACGRASRAAGRRG